MLPSACSPLAPQQAHVRCTSCASLLLQCSLSCILLCSAYILRHCDSPAARSSYCILGTGAPTRPPTRHARQHTPALQTPQNTANLLHLDDDPLAAAAAAPAEEATAAAESENMGAAASAAADGRAAEAAATAAAAEGEQEVTERGVDLAVAPPTEDEATPEAAATKAQPADLAAPEGADDVGPDAIPDDAPAGQQAAAPADAPAAIAGDGQGSAGTVTNQVDADMQPAEREVSSPHVGDAVAAGAAVTEAIPTAAEPGDDAETPNADHMGAVPDFETPQPAEAMTEDEVVAVWRGPTVRLSQDHDEH